MIFLVSAHTCITNTVFLQPGVRGLIRPREDRVRSTVLSHVQPHVFEEAPEIRNLLDMIINDPDGIIYTVRSGRFW